MVQTVVSPPLVSGSSLPTQVAFTATVPLDGNKVMTAQAVSSVIAFTPGSSPMTGAQCYVRVQADGTNVPTFTGFTELGTSAGYNNTAGAANLILFIYDGVKAYFSIGQELSVVAFVMQSGAIANSTPTKLDITFDRDMNQTITTAASAFTIFNSSGADTVSAAAWTSARTLQLTKSRTTLYGDTVTLSYAVPGSNPLTDATGNVAGPRSAMAVTNNVASLGTLGTLTLSGTLVLGTATTGTISGATSGSTIVSNVSGLTVNSAPRTYSWSGTGTAATTANGLVETLAGAANSPANSPITVAAASAPANTAAPVASGTGTIGQVLSVTNGTWTNSPTSYAYQWKRNGTAISGATSSTYTLVTADGGTSVTCTVTATNGTGSTSATSNAISVAAAATANYIRIPSATNATETANGDGSYAYHATGNGSWGSGSALGVSTASLPAGADGYVEYQATGSFNGFGPLLGFQTGTTISYYADQTYTAGVNGTTVHAGSADSGYANTTTTLPTAVNSWLRLQRTGTTMKIRYSTDGTTYSDLYTFPNPSSEKLYVSIDIGSNDPSADMKRIRASSNVV